MTWHTSGGDRVLEGTEAKLYLAALQLSFEPEFEFGDWRDCQLWGYTGNDFFHRASLNQQIFLINYCLKALLNPDIPMPKLNHTLEAAAFYPFAYLEAMIKEEIDNENREKIQSREIDDKSDYLYRRMVWEAFEELELPMLLESDREEGYINEEDDTEEEENIDKFYQVKYKSTDWRSWEFAVGCLADNIFWDTDWEMVSYQPELLDGMDYNLSANLGIDEGYFSNRLPKVTDEQAEALLEEIMYWDLPGLEMFKILGFN
jgi:hypothetical protein